MKSEIPAPGSYVVDTRTGRVAKVMGSQGLQVQLRSPAGGCEWDCPPEALRPARTSEELGARVHSLNQQSRLP